MVVKIYGSKISTCTQRVCTVLKELGVEYEVVPIDLLSHEQKNEEYVKNKHPFGLIPVLEDEDGFTLFESRAISRYVAEKFGDGKLLPKDLKGRALFEQAASVEQANFDPFSLAIVRERVFKPMFGRKGDEAIVDENHSILESKLAGYEIILSKQEYLGGNKITLADLFHLPNGSLLTEKAGSQLLKSDKFPNVKRWWADISSRETWKAIQAELAK